MMIRFRRRVIRMSKIASDYQRDMDTRIGLSSFFFMLVSSQVVSISSTDLADDQ